MKILHNYITGRSLGLAFSKSTRVEDNKFLKWFKLNLSIFEDELKLDFFEESVFSLQLSFEFQANGVMIVKNKGQQIGALQLVEVNIIKL